jgi:enoyl-CoA hydratase/carnithine racemase
MERHLVETTADGVATLTLNRPDRLNALSTPIIEGLLEALPRLAEDTEVGAIVLTGAGRAFCSGGDVKSMTESIFSFEYVEYRPDMRPPALVDSVAILQQ